ncbi:hypothetical protein [Methylobacterium sp. CM6246]
MSDPSIGQVTRTISRRMPWQVASTVFNWLDIQPSKGWDSTVEKYHEAKGYEDEAARLLTAYREHIVSGEKAVRIYAQPKTTCDAVRAWLLSRQEGLTDPNRYLFRDVTEIKSLTPTEPRLISVESFATGLAGVYESIRVTEIRERIDPRRLSRQDGQTLDDFQELIGVRLEKKQLFDVVWVPHTGTRIDIRVDSPVGTTIENQGAAHLALAKKFTAEFGKDLFKVPINLFPLIKAMYEDPNEGMVAELGFATSTGSVKIEKMRRAHTCLRRELYHKAGKAALSRGIEPFKLSVRWQAMYEEKARSHLELSLKGNTRLLHMTVPLLYDADIRGCAGIADFEYVRSRLEYHLDRLNP